MTTKKKEQAAPTFEEALHTLEDIVARLERGDVPLEESIRLYEEAIGLSKTCAEKLTQAELILKRLAKDLDGSFKLLDEDEGE